MTAVTGFEQASHSRRRQRIRRSSRVQYCDSTWDGVTARETGCDGHPRHPGRNASPAPAVNLTDEERAQRNDPLVGLMVCRRAVGSVTERGH